VRLGAAASRKRGFKQVTEFGAPYERRLEFVAG